MVDDRAEGFRPGWLNRASCAAITPAVTAALLSLDGQLGPVSFTLRRAIALVVIAVVAGFRMGRSRGWGIAGWVGVIATLALVARAPSVPSALVGFVLALAAIETAAKSTAAGAGWPDGLLPACLAYVALRLAVDLVPQAGAITEMVARVASHSINAARGFDARLSFTVLGGPAVILAVLYLLWSWRRAGGMARPFAAVIIPLAWFAALPFVMPDVSAGPLAGFSRGAWHGLFWLSVAGLLGALLPFGGQFNGDSTLPDPPLSRAGKKDGVAGADPGRAGEPPGVRPRRVSLAAACLAAALAGVCLVGTALIGPTAGKSIRVHNRGGLDWDRPVFGRFGAFSGGMFGLLPVYCRSEGYDFDIIDADAIDAADLEGVQVLVLINSPKVWDETERRTVLDFVAQGGSLLVLGDHTDVFGLMRGFNSLLEPLGIRFRFDSAFKAREGWRGCQAAAPDAVAWGWDEENPGVAVGASLELSGSARPLLFGRYGFSDAGVRENVVGSFLGNYHYDQGERLGDVVLVATATHGRGRVVVWGDTSAFQGVSSYYAKAVGPMLAWLSRPTAWTERIPVRIAAAAGLLAAILWLWIVQGSLTHVVLVALSLLAGMVIPWCLSLPHLDARVRVADDTVLIDRSHFPATGHYNARVNPIGPLSTNLLRCGFRTVDMEAWDPAAIARARGVALVAPQRPFTSEEIALLLRAEEGGSVVLLVVGQPDSFGSRRLLDAHGLALLPKPMGTVTSAAPTASRREREQQPRFLDAWPIVTANGGDPAGLPGVEVIYRHGEDVVALFQQRGQGGLLLIADTRFFSDMNIEDMSGFWPGNLALVHDMFRRYLGADPDAVQPVFRSPEKPQ